MVNSKVWSIAKYGAVLLGSSLLWGPSEAEIAAEKEAKAAVRARRLSKATAVLEEKSSDGILNTLNTLKPSNLKSVFTNGTEEDRKSATSTVAAGGFIGAGIGAGAAVTAGVGTGGLGVLFIAPAMGVGGTLGLGAGYVKAQGAYNYEDSLAQAVVNKTAAQAAVVLGPAKDAAERVAAQTAKVTGLAAAARGTATLALDAKNAVAEQYKGSYAEAGAKNTVAAARGAKDAFINNSYVQAGADRFARLGRAVNPFNRTKPAATPGAELPESNESAEYTSDRSLYLPS